jgi:hypothetical protein
MFTSSTSSMLFFLTFTLDVPTKLVNDALAYSYWLFSVGFDVFVTFTFLFFAFGDKVRFLCFLNCVPLWKASALSLPLR